MSKPLRVSSSANGRATKDNIFFAHALGWILLSTFIPYKIYPLVYLGASVFMLRGGLRKKGSGARVSLLLFICYAAFSYVGLGDANNSDARRAIVKLLINSGLFFSVYSSMELTRVSGPEFDRIFRVFSQYTRVCLVLSCLQLLYLQLLSGGVRFSAESSYEAGLMFENARFFFGAEDKNIFGAKIGLYGFLHLVFLRNITGKLGKFDVCLVIFASLLTLSRTALVFTLVTTSVLFLRSIRRREFYYFLIPIAALIFSYVLPKLAALVRIDSILDGHMDDGMGIRLLFWRIFFQNFGDISVWGNGVLSAESFVARNSWMTEVSNLHNIFMNTYLDLGVPGISLFLLFLFFFLKDVVFRRGGGLDSLIVFVPLFVMVNTLYTAYDNDFWVYISIAYVASVWRENKSYE